MVVLRFARRLRSKWPAFRDIFLVSRKEWFIPAACDVLIFDRSGSEALMPYFQRFKADIVAVRGESINMYCLFCSLWNVDFWKGKPLKAYLYTYIKLTTPKLCVTFIDNNPLFYSISARFPGLKTLFWQNGVRDQWLPVQTGVTDYMVDFMFVFNRHVGGIYSRHIRGEVVCAGSLKNNYVEKVHTILKGTVLFISTFVSKPLGEAPLLVYDNGDKVFWSEFSEPDRLILGFLKDWCASHRKRLIVGGCVLGDTAQEQAFYHGLLAGCDWEYAERRDIYSTYRLIDSADIVATIDSTMGYEALSRGKKTAFFSCRGVSIKRNDRGFGWPAILSVNGPFWTDDQDEKQFCRVMNFLNEVSLEEWESIRSGYLDELMVYDPGNRRFVELLDRLLP